MPAAAAGWRPVQGKLRELFYSECYGYRSGIGTPSSLSTFRYSAGHVDLGGGEGPLEGLIEVELLELAPGQQDSCKHLLT